MNVNAARGIILNDSRYPATPGLLERLLKHFTKTAARQQPLELDDRMLRDIGVTRADIEIRGFLN